MRALAGTACAVSFTFLVGFLVIADERPAGDATIPALAAVFLISGVIWLVWPPFTRWFWQAVARRVARYLHTGDAPGPGHVTPVQGTLRFALREVRQEVHAARDTVAGARAQGKYWPEGDPKRRAWKRHKKFVAREAPGDAYEVTAAAYAELKKLIEARGFKTHRDFTEDDNVEPVVRAFDEASNALGGALDRLDRETPHLPAGDTSSA